MMMADVRMITWKYCQQHYGDDHDDIKDNKYDIRHQFESVWAAGDDGDYESTQYRVSQKFP